MRSEVGLIQRIRQAAERQCAGLLMGIGDDCAVLEPPPADRLTLVTTDTLVEGVHFDLAWHPPELLGRKALAVNVSDIAAMGGLARFALLSLAIPPSLAEDVLDGFQQGVLAGVAQYDLGLIGGDTVRSDHGLVVTITVLGEGRRDQVRYRSGARIGDLIWVSGYLGQAAAGLEVCRLGRPAETHRFSDLVAAHLDPQPETRLGPALAASGLVTAMIDMSDGLGSDLAHICQESRVGAMIRANDLPISDSCRQAATALGGDALEWAIRGGEDYRLLFTAPPAATPLLSANAKQSVGGHLFPIGEIVPGQGVSLQADSTFQRIDFLGYDHFGVSR